MTGLQTLLLGTALLPSQHPAQRESGPLFRSDTHLVVCHTTVLDKSRRAIHDLPQTAFTVYEDGAAQPIRAFAQEDVPVSLGLVIDNSATMADKRSSVVAASLALVRASNPADEVFVVNFNHEAYLDLPGRKDFTSDIRAMEQALARLDARGSPLLRDAIRASIEHLASKGQRDKKVLVVVAGGEDTRSAYGPEELLRLAQQSGVVIYAVGLLEYSGCANPRAARRTLASLAQATGGEAYFPKRASEVGEISRRIARDIREQYVIGYEPLNTRFDGAFRRITILVSAPGQPSARTRSGYYATAEPAVQRKGMMR